MTLPCSNLYAKLLNHMQCVGLLGALMRFFGVHVLCWGCMKRRCIPRVCPCCFTEIKTRKRMKDEDDGFDEVLKAGSFPFAVAQSCF